MTISKMRLASPGQVFVALATGLVAGALYAAQAAEPLAPAGAAAADPVFDVLDVDRNGALSRHEFEVGYAGLQRLAALQARLAERFDALDANHDAAIDAGEYTQLELIKAKGRAAPPLSEFDADRNQALSFAEYETLVRKLAARPAQKPR